jgi:hypothetical protein
MGSKGGLEVHGFTRIRLENEGCFENQVSYPKKSLEARGLGSIKKTSHHPDRRVPLPRLMGMIKVDGS